jgi:hypothetical protein
MRDGTNSQEVREGLPFLAGLCGGRRNWNASSPEKLQERFWRHSMGWVAPQAQSELLALARTQPATSRVHAAILSHLVSRHQVVKAQPSTILRDKFL